MKSKSAIWGAIALVLAAPAAVAATPGFYLGAAYEPLSFKTDDAGDFDVSTIGVKAGVRVHPFFAVEARAGVGVEDDTRNVLGTDVTTELDNYYGAYVKGIVPVHESFSLYGLAGWSKVKATSSSALGDESDTDDGLSYGAGVAFNINPQFSINAEWIRYLSKDDYDLEGYGVGFAMKF